MGEGPEALCGQGLGSESHAGLMRKGAVIHEGRLPWDPGVRACLCQAVVPYLPIIGALPLLSNSTKPTQWSDPTCSMLTVSPSPDLLVSSSQEQPL